MSFALIFLGVLMVVSAIRGTYVCLVNTFIGDFTGPGNFLYWVAALMIIGAIGYSETLKPLSDGLLILVLVALVVTRGRQGLFTNLTAALGNTGGGGTTSGLLGSAQQTVGSLTQGGALS